MQSRNPSPAQTDARRHNSSQIHRPAYLSRQAALVPERSQARALHGRRVFSKARPSSWARTRANSSAS